MMAAQDLSNYPIPTHVTAKRKQKAILPLQVELHEQKVVLYDETIRKGNTLQALNSGCQTISRGRNSSVL